jgi:creatinine amidohydrolase/Fe(II)-dependent formamide hydrolase-like protein
MTRERSTIMERHAFLLLLAVVFPLAPASAQAASSAPQPPNTVFIEELTWDEVRDLMAAGKTSAIIATAGTEQKGPHMVMGEHRFVLEHTADRIARTLGDALVAPIMTYVPEGDWSPPSSHMRMAGTITLPNDRFMMVLEHTARSLKGGGFKNIILIGDSGGNQSGMRDVAAKLNSEWKGTGVRVHFIGDYYTKAMDAQRSYITDSLKIPRSEIGNHAGILDTSEMLAVNPNHVRMDKRASGGGFQGSGVSGDPTKASAEIGRKLLQIKIDHAVAQIRASVAEPEGQR